MNSTEAKLQFGEEVRIPKPSPGGFLLSGDRVFFTYQGEGHSLGKPAIFIRLHMCNLHCNWTKSGGGICDAYYTWNTHSKDYWTQHSFISFEDMLKEVQKYPCNRIVFTGGEPLIQQEQIVEFLQGYLDDNYIVEIETNGTILPFIGLINSGPTVWFNCSPKLSSAGMEKKDCIKPDVLRRINDYPHSIFKFVVTGKEDLSEVEEIVKECSLSYDKVFIMPEGVDNEILAKRIQELVEVVKERGWSLTPRLQIYIWGNKRGT